MPLNRGTYCLVLSCREDTEAAVGKLGRIRFEPGYYAYIGSALSNMDKRITRHMGNDKKVFWHIDRLTTHKGFAPCKAYAIYNPRRLECGKAGELGKYLPSIAGFGSSDCRCRSHLFYAGRGRASLERLEKLLSRFGFESYDTSMITYKKYGKK